MNKICKYCNTEQYIKIGNVCKKCQYIKYANRRKTYRKNKIMNEKVTSEIICIGCNCIFTQRRKDHIYCSDKCKTNSIRRSKNIYKKTCVLCKFVAVHPCQLDKDHIDGNHNNNDVDNIQIICSNCHRLKTYHQKMNK